ncbi:DNA-directed RNA polymerase subunit alpha [bacterium]|nr:DNA-directed RNA polymerase subunit alpha [bacterium]|tara:strand:+ start:7472 stop:8446 length:975 start_codon:yes stop_codon:yes gene_type:complete
MHLIQEEIGLPSIKIEETDQNTTIFTISPLPSGYGTTLGNAMRRVLLSSVPGTAVTGIKVKGKNYEYSTIEGASDSVLQMLLNLKQLNVKLNNVTQADLTLKADKKGDVTASMIEKDANVEILNPELVVTTLEDKTNLEITIRVEKNVGYITSKERQAQETLVDWIWTDAFYSPVKKVRFHQENTRVGQMTNLDKLTLEIQTNGSITPTESMRFASNLLTSYFSLFNEEKIAVESDFLSNVDSISSKQQSQIVEAPAKETYTPIEILGLSPRTLNACINGDIGSIEQLVKCSEAKLSNLRGFGKKALNEVKDALAGRGLSLADE